MFTNIGTYISKSIDSMFAVDLKAHVMGMFHPLFSLSYASKVYKIHLAGYEFLMQNCMSTLFQVFHLIYDVQTMWGIEYACLGSQEEPIPLGGTSYKEFSLHGR